MIGLSLKLVVDTPLRQLIITVIFTTFAQTMQSLQPKMKMMLVYRTHWPSAPASGHSSSSIQSHEMLQSSRRLPMRIFARMSNENPPKKLTSGSNARVSVLLALSHSY